MRARDLSALILCWRNDGRSPIERAPVSVEVGFGSGRVCVGGEKCRAVTSKLQIVGALRAKCPVADSLRHSRSQCDGVMAEIACLPHP